VKDIDPTVESYQIKIKLFLTRREEELRKQEEAARAKEEEESPEKPKLPEAEFAVN
jgi:hypothetical protein